MPTGVDFRLKLSIAVVEENNMKFTHLMVPKHFPMGRID